MEANNPYEAPTSSVGGAEQFGDWRALSVSSRIGRLRYLAYSAVATLGVATIAITILFAFTLLGLSVDARVIMLLTYLTLIAGNIVLTVKRCHDINWSGWLTLLIIIPFVPLIFCLKRGTPGPNRFGLPPPSNSTGVVFLAFAPMLLGIIAAITIPAYQQYTRLANAAKAQHQ